MLAEEQKISKALDTVALHVYISDVIAIARILCSMARPQELSLYVWQSLSIF